MYEKVKNGNRQFASDTVLQDLFPGSSTVHAKNCQTTSSNSGYHAQIGARNHKSSLQHSLMTHSSYAGTEEGRTSDGVATVSRID